MCLARFALPISVGDPHSAGRRRRKREKKTKQKTIEMDRFFSSGRALLFTFGEVSKGRTLALIVGGLVAFLRCSFNNKKINKLHRILPKRQQKKTVRRWKNGFYISPQTGLQIRLRRKVCVCVCVEEIKTPKMSLPAHSKRPRIGKKRRHFAAVHSLGTKKRVEGRGGQGRLVKLGKTR